ncbi:hypothetical protein QM012_002781 [Aureobasidium pullulans]|uniref:BTB domain-containing protein n=1 Tax=Aureobasidium pullulans TaxID=5580 RepID=A0ABR0TBU4_AURPU
MTTPSTITKPSKDKVKLIYNTRMVTIEVGIEKEHFVIHQSFLCAKSQYFTKALSGSFKESITRSIELPDVSPILFRIFVAWIYHGTLVYFLPSDTTIDNDLDSLKITENDLEQKTVYQSKAPNNEESNSDNSGNSIPDLTVVNYTSSVIASAGRNHDRSSALRSTDTASSTKEPKYQGDDPTSWPYSVFVRLYILADRFDVRSLRADCLDALLNFLGTDHATFDSKDIHYIFQNTSAASRLRRLVIDHTVYYFKFESDAFKYEELPKEFLATVMVASSRRMPLQLCGRCHKASVKEDYDSDDSYDEDDEGDIAPFEKDPCLYHEHPNDEEREACRLRRESSKSAT